MYIFVVLLTWLVLCFSNFFKIAIVTKDFKLKIDFDFSFHLILLSDFYLDFYCSLLSSGVVNIIYK